MYLKNRYDYIISIGFFCSVALEIERLGYRDATYPFDWVTNRLSAVNELIANNFKDLFNPDKLVYEQQGSSIIKHTEYEFRFYHDFNTKCEIKEQICNVKMKYEKRIKRFIEILNSDKNVLFLRYVYDQKEKNEIVDFIKLMNNYPCNYKIVLIINNSINLNLKNPNILKVFSVVPDLNDTVKRKFIVKNSEIYQFFKRELKYNKFKRLRNLYFFYKKKIKNRVFKLLVCLSSFTK